MTTSDIIKKLFQSFSSRDTESFETAAREYIEREKRKKHNVVAKELEKALFSNITSSDNSLFGKRFINSVPIPRDSEKGFPLLEIQKYDKCFNDIILPEYTKKQLEKIIKEFNDSDILSTYNLKYKNKILLCGKPGTGKTYSAQILSSVLNLPLVYVRFDSIISSYLGETAGNLRKVFDFIENGTWLVLFDEFDIIGKNRDDAHEHGEIKRVVNNFLQMLDNLKGESIVLAATNHQNMLDPAIWRRFDDVIYYDLPNLETRKILLDKYLKPIKRESRINLGKFVNKTNGLSPADLKMICEEAMKSAITNSRNSLNSDDLMEAVEAFILREKVKRNELGSE